MHVCFCWSIGRDDDNTHCWVCIRAIDLFHGPCVRIIVYCKDTSPLERTVSVSVVVVVGSCHLKGNHVEAS